MKLLRNSPSCSDVVFPYVQDLLQSALDKGNGEYLIGDIRNELATGHLTLWVGVDSEEAGIEFAATSIIIEYPQYKSLQIRHLGAMTNTFTRWIDYCWDSTSPLMEYCHDNGCNRIEIWGRKGWTRMLEGAGFRETYLSLTKDIG